MKEFDPVLIDYLLDSVSSEERVEIERRLDSDPALREQMVEMQKTLVHHSPSIDPPNSSIKDRIMTSVSPETRYFGFTDRLAELFDLSAESITGLLTAARKFPDAPWEASLVPNMRAFHFEGGKRLGGAECGLVHLKPGTTFPVHRHQGDEVSFILEGEMTDSSGEVYLPGDVVRLSKGQAHGYTSTGDLPLVFAVYHNGIEIESR